MNLARSLLAMALPAVVLSGVGPRSSVGAPAGKAWTPIDNLRSPLGGALAPQRFDRSPDGELLATCAALGSRPNQLLYAWRDTAWVLVDQLGYGVGLTWPTVAYPSRPVLVWRTLDQIGPSNLAYLAVDWLEGERFGTPDTVAQVWGSASEYTACTSVRRTWAAVDDLAGLRIFYSDTATSWAEVPVVANVRAGVTAAALDDTTALFVWANQAGSLLYGVLRGMAWEASPLPYTGLLGRPRLRPRPSGGFWLAWATKRESDAIATYRDGAWSPAESLRCAYDSPDPFYADTPYLSSDSAEVPAIAWSSFNGRTGLETICVATSDANVTVAEDVAGSDGGILPCVARDIFGDVWLGWWTYFDGAFFMHTYVRATASEVEIAASGSALQVRWTLSELALGSYWTILRSRLGGTFDSVATVRAGASTSLVWTDSAASPDLAWRYRVRRESTDHRYRDLSPEAAWIPRSHGLHLSLVGGGNPSRGLYALEIRGVPDTGYAVEVYDVQGRSVLRLAVDSSGGGSVQVQLTLPMPGMAASGIYFAQATTRSQRSNVVKLVFTP